MTPKEKAKELVSKIYETLLRNDYLQSYDTAKKCSLIAVDEIITNGFNPQLPYNFWEQVKAEIEKL